MGIDIAVVSLLVVSVIVALGVILFGDKMRRADEAAIARAWAAYARANKLTFEAAVGEWPNRTLPRVVGADVTISAVRVGENVITRMVVKPKDTMLGRLYVTTREPDTDLPAAAMPSGALDDDVRVFAMPATLVARVLTEDVRRAFSAFRMGGALLFEFERGKVTLEWDRGELNSARLDEARRLAALVERAVHAAFVGDPTAPISAGK